MAQVNFLNQTERKIEAKRLDERVNYDLEMIRELGYCSGIEKIILGILMEEALDQDPSV